MKLLDAHSLALRVGGLDEIAVGAQPEMLYDLPKRCLYNCVAGTFHGQLISLNYREKNVMNDQTQETLSKAKALIEAKRYEDARAILIPLEHPTAEKWLAKLNQIISSHSTPTSIGSNVPPRSASNALPPSQMPVYHPSATNAYYQPYPESFTGKFILTIFLLLVFLIPGMLALVIFAREAKEAQKRSSQPIPGAKELIFLNRAVFVFLCLILLSVPVLVFIQMVIDYIR
jgi:hypothetical protein